MIKITTVAVPGSVVHDERNLEVDMYPEPVIMWMTPTHIICTYAHIPDSAASDCISTYCPHRAPSPKK